MTDIRIYKYEAAIEHVIFLNMYEGSNVLRMACLDPGVLTLWAHVDLDARKRGHRFRVYGTGHAIRSKVEDYLGTVLDRSFVWHVYQDHIQPTRIQPTNKEQS